MHIVDLGREQELADFLGGDFLGGPARRDERIFRPVFVVVFWRNYPVIEKVELVEGLLDRGILDESRRGSKLPGRCCAAGCQIPEPPRGAEARRL